MSLSRIRNRIEALERKFAVSLAVFRLRPLAEEICNEWDASGNDGTPLPDPHSLIRRIADRGFRLPTFMPLVGYLGRCRRDDRCPQPRDVVSMLLPHAAKRGIVANLFRWDAAA